MRLSLRRAGVGAGLRAARWQVALGRRWCSPGEPGSVSAVTRSSLLKGVLLGALSVLVLEGLVVAAWLFATRDEPPEPTATRREVRGTVTQTDPQLCVRSGSGAPEPGAAPALGFCGLALGGVAAGTAVGDVVVGQLVDIELDPGSGAAWVLWSSVGPSAE